MRMYFSHVSVSIENALAFFFFYFPDKPEIVKEYLATQTLCLQRDMEVRVYVCVHLHAEA